MTNAIEHIDAIKSKIHTVRGQRVMLDKDLASLYGVEVRVLNQAVKRNIKRFPEDFMFQLNAEEWEILKSHFVTSSWGGARKVPYAFTEQGVAMLSSVLKSETAIEVNIRIMRAFVAYANTSLLPSATIANSKARSTVWLPISRRFLPTRTTLTKRTVATSSSSMRLSPICKPMVLQAASNV